MIQWSTDTEHAFREERARAIVRACPGAVTVTEAFLAGASAGGLVVYALMVLLGGA